MDWLSYELHKLTARLDRAADHVLQAEMDTTYSRFLMLFAAQQGAQSQRELAAWLGITEPSVSRMTGVLAADGLLEVSTSPGSGNRRHLRLTAAGEDLVRRSSQALEGRFIRLVEASGVPYDEYEAHTLRLIKQLEAEGIGPLLEGPGQ
jgi:DNA-binding MarR family transcriptional regulator